jgi:hypothetical protein
MRREPVRKLLIGAAMAGTLLGTGAIVGASIPSSQGKITACIKPGGATRIIDYEAGARCHSGEKRISWPSTQTPGPRGPRGPAGPSHLTYTENHNQVTIAQTGETTIATLEGLPAGSYLLQAHLTAVYGNATDWTAVRCAIRAAGQDSFGTVGSAIAVGQADPAAWFAQGFMSLPVTSTEAFDATLYCIQTRFASTAYVEESRLFALAVGSITTQ